MSSALPRFVPDADPAAGSTLAGLLSHLDAVYAFAHALTSAPDLASDLSERVYRGVTRDLWSTLGGHGLRDRLLARCFAIFTQELGARARSSVFLPAHPRDADLVALLAALPLEERAAVALVDRLGLSYSAGAAVLGSTPEEFRAFLHRGRNVLMTWNVSPSRVATRANVP